MKKHGVYLDHPHPQREHPGERDQVAAGARHGRHDRSASGACFGKESVGKSQRVAALTGRRAVGDNFPGSTITCEVFVDGFFTYIDPPGLLRRSDSHASRLALDSLSRSDRVLQVASAAHLDPDIDDLLGLAENKHGAIVVTFWDKMASILEAENRLSLIRWSAQVPVIAVNARRLAKA